jgi:hypothetical protein
MYYCVQNGEKYLPGEGRPSKNEQRRGQARVLQGERGESSKEREQKTEEEKR